MTNNKVLYVGRPVPSIGAAGIRVMNIADLLSKIGYDVHFLANTKQVNVADDAYPVHFVSIKDGKFASIRNIANIVTGCYLYESFLKNCNDIKPQYVILYNETYSSSKKIICYCHKHSIKVIIDNTEWYEKTPLHKGLADFLLTRSVDWRIRKVDQLSDGVIAISKFLTDYYEKKGIPVVNIPPIIEIPQTIIGNEFVSVKETIRFVYAGSPAAKDILLPFLLALYRYNKNECHRFSLDLYGIDTAYLKSLSGLDDFETYSIHAHGLVCHDTVLQAIDNAHFSILFRKPQRYALAGYSTKFAECLSWGTPMICNKIGGTDADIIDGRNGYLVDDIEPATLDAFLKSISRLTDAEYISMRQFTRQYAVSRYSGETYISQLTKLFQ